MPVKPIPDGYHTITPYLVVDDPAAVIEFLKKAFGAQQTYAMRDPQGRVKHAEVKVGTSMLMLGGAQGEWTARPGNFYLYVEDCDAVYKKALAAGACVRVGGAKRGRPSPSEMCVPAVSGPIRHAR